VLAKPVQLIALDNMITAGKEGAAVPNVPNVTFVHHDAIYPFAWDEPLHYVIHAAGIASPFYYRAYPLETLEVAINGTKHMLELAHRHQARFTFFSSSEIYGDPDPKHVPMQESYRGNVSCQGPRACYDESKRVGETLCYIFHEKHGVATNTIRPFNIFGPGMQETDYRVMPNFASRIKAGRPLNVYGSGQQTRTFCYVTDAMVGFLLVILKGVPGEAYNIGNPMPEISVLDLVRCIETVLDRPIAHNVIEYPDSYPADEPSRRCPDIRKARLQLGYEPMVDLNEGLRRFFTWSAEAYTGQI
jgi:UDP-glucuronate decarboxylase